MLRLRITPPDGTAYTLSVAQLPVRIGRSTRSELRLDDPFASRLHAELRAEGDAYRISDLGSGNGIVVNGRPIGTSTLVRPGDEVRIGNSVLRLEEAGELVPGEAVARGSGADLVLRPQALRREGGTAHLRTTYLDAALDAVREAAASGSHQVVHHRNELFSVLSKVGAALLSPAELDEVLNQILDLIFEAVEAERAYLMLREEEGADGLVCKLASFRHGRPPGPEREVHISASIVDEVFGHGRPVLTSDAQADARFKDRHSIILSGVRSVMAAPLALNERILGLLYVDSPAAANVFTEDDLRMLVTIATIAAIKVEHALLLEERLRHERLLQELTNAREIQSRLLPLVAPPTPGYEVAGASFPCGEVGGDYFDYIDRGEGRLLLALGDVSGKGLDAALLMASLHAALRVQAGMGVSLPDLLAGVNRFLHGSSPANRFVTLIAAELDPARHRLVYVSAGHNPALLIRDSGQLVELPASGLPLGVQAEVAYEEREVRFAPGDVLVIYSDGISEAVNGDGEEFTAERLVAVVRQYHGALASELQELSMQELGTFLGTASRTDDATLIVVRRVG